MALLVGAVAMWNVSYYNAFLSLRFTDHYGIPDYQMGYYNLFLTGPYIFSCMLLPMLLKSIPRRFQFILCFFSCIVSSVLMGPTFIPDNLVPVCAGMSLIGIVVSLSFIPALPEAIDQTLVRFKIVEGANEELDTAMHDTLSSLYNMISNGGSLISPIIGGALYDLFGYVRTTQVSAILMVIITLLYVFLNCGMSVFKDTKEEIEILKELRAK